MPPLPVHLLLFSRAPVAGATKTRLAAAVGDAAARAFHVACLLDLLDEAQAWQAHTPGGQVHVFITPAGSGTAFTLAGVRWPATVHLHNQAGDTLGGRMHDAFTRVSRAAPGRAVLVGTDLPLLRREVLDAAVQALTGADVVFGPTPDGGYYLIGVHQPYAGLFDSPQWGSASVLAQSLAAAAGLGLRTAQVAKLPDVDVAEDVAAVLAHPAAAALAQRRAIRLLRAWEAEGRIPAPGR